MPLGAEIAQPLLGWSASAVESTGNDFGPLEAAREVDKTNTTEPVIFMQWQAMNGPSGVYHCWTCLSAVLGRKDSCTYQKTSPPKASHHQEEEEEEDCPP